MDRMAALEDRGKVTAHFPDLVVADIGTEDLRQDCELAVPRELLVVEVRRIRDDGMTKCEVDLFANLVVYGALHWNVTLQKMQKQGLLYNPFASLGGRDGQRSVGVNFRWSLSSLLLSLYQ